MLGPKLCLKLFDTLIVPILSYASEIWATEITVMIIVLRVYVCLISDLSWE